MTQLNSATLAAANAKRRIRQSGLSVAARSVAAYPRLNGAVLSGTAHSGP